MLANPDQAKKYSIKTGKTAYRVVQSIMDTYEVRGKPSISDIRFVKKSAYSTQASNHYKFPAETLLLIEDITEKKQHKIVNEVIKHLKAAEYYELPSYLDDYAIKLLAEYLTIALTLKKNRKLQQNPKIREHLIGLFQPSDEEVKESKALLLELSLLFHGLFVPNIIPMP
jgi:geranylgeranyl pyrophosphate synthase